MGFRSTLATEDMSGIKLPRWFVEKYKEDFNFRTPMRGSRSKTPTLFLSSKYEVKTYGIGSELAEDFQKVIKAKKLDNFVFVWLHECGGITRVEIRPESITYSEPTDWKITDGVEHDYCYGCSDVDNLVSHPKKEEVGGQALKESK